MIGIKVEMTPIGRPQFIGKMSQELNLNFFNGFKHLKTEFSIKNIEIEDISKSGSVYKAIKMKIALP